MRTSSAALILVSLVSCRGERAPSAGAVAPTVEGSALHRAAGRGDLKELRALLGQGEAVDQLGPEEWTALHHAAQRGQAGAIAQLLDAGADLEARGRYDMRPLHWAALAGELAAVTLLLERGAQVDAGNLYGMTPLHLAASPEIGQRLLAAGAPLEARDVRGMTPLHFARSRELAKVLMDRGADVNVRDRRGLTPVDMTGVADCTPAGLLVFPEREAVRLRGQEARLGFLLWNITTRAMSRLEVQAESPAADIVIAPARLEAFRAAQMTELQARFSRRADAAAGKYPLTLRFVTAGGEVARCALEVDTRAGPTPEDRGMIPVGSVKVREQPAWPQYLGYAAMPVIVVIVWLVWRRREGP